MKIKPPLPEKWNLGVVQPHIALKSYLVESLGDIFLVIRGIVKPKARFVGSPRRTANFRLSQMDFKLEQWRILSTTDTIRRGGRVYFFWVESVSGEGYCKLGKSVIHYIYERFLRVPLSVAMIRGNFPSDFDWSQNFNDGHCGLRIEPHPFSVVSNPRQKAEMAYKRLQAERQNYKQ